MLGTLHARLEGKKVVILGVGNPMRGDDGIGPCLADRLQGKVGAIIINAGDVPENYLGPVAAAQPEVVVIVDAADLGTAPGGTAIIEANELAEVALSTHNASLRLFIKVLQSEVQADVFLLGVQPASMAFGAPMSQAVVITLGLLEELFQSCCPTSTSTPTSESHPQPIAGEAWQLVELVEMALKTRSLEDLAERILPGVARMIQSSLVLLVVDPRLPTPRFFQYGLQPEAASEIEDLCIEQFDQIVSQRDLSSLSVPASPAWEIATQLILYPLRIETRCLGLVGLAADEDAIPTSPGVLERLFHSLADVIDRLVECIESERQLSHLNTYLTISSMLAQSLGLHELLEIALYCCMDAVSAEAASVLLLDDEKQNFNFYQVEGPAKPVLMAATFPADRRLAGSILQTQQAEIINDVPNDPRFYERVDSESGFQTWNMIAIPLTAGGERVGVLEG